jgi:hypothetical protein
MTDTTNTIPIAFTDGAPGVGEQIESQTEFANLDETPVLESNQTTNNAEIARLLEKIREATQQLKLSEATLAAIEESLSGRQDNSNVVSE